MQQVIAESVAGVEVVFGEGECAGGGGGPGVDQGGLQHLVFVVAAAHEAAAILHVDVNLGAQIEIVAQPGEALAHDGVGDDAVDLDGGHIGAAAVKGARNVPPASGSDDQGLRAGANRIRERRTVDGEVVAVLRSEVGEIEFRDGRRGVGVDHNPMPAIGLPKQADARKIVPGGEDLVGNGLPFGVTDGEDGMFLVPD